jgi:hypothetical protein
LLPELVYLFAYVRLLLGAQSRVHIVTQPHRIEQLEVVGRRIESRIY